MAASSVGRMLPIVAPVPSVGWADVGAQGTPSEVTKRPAMAVIPLPSTWQMGLPTTLVAPTVVGVTQLVMTPPMRVEVATAVIGGS